MKRFFVRSLVSVLLCLTGCPAVAEPVSAADTVNVRAVVQAQLAAFAADDAARAFSFAAPNIREMFGSAERFMSMVRSSYPVVYRPIAVAFLVPEQAGGEVIQGVHFTDAQGALWLATYHLELQGDNAWRIRGCDLVASHARAT